MNNNLPPLPKHLMIFDQSDDSSFGSLVEHAWDSDYATMKVGDPMFTADQMRDYARAALAAQPVAQAPADPMNYKDMFLAAVSALAEIDSLLGLPEDGCNDPQVTVSALKDYIAGAKEIAGFRDQWVDAQYAEASKPVQAEAPSGLLAEIKERVAAAHDESLDEDHRGCRRILMGVLQLINDAPPPARCGAVEREAFEVAYRRLFGKRWVVPQYQDMFKREGDRYAELSVHDLWTMWQARAALAAQPLEQKPLAWGALYFGGKRNGKLYAHCETEQQIDEYIGQVHRSNDSITLSKAPLYLGPQPEQVAQDSARLDWLTGQLVDTIYLDDGRIIDVGTGKIGQTNVRISPHDLRSAIDAARASGKKGGA